MKLTYLDQIEQLKKKKQETIMYLQLNHSKASEILQAKHPDFPLQDDCKNAKITASSVIFALLNYLNNPLLELR